MNRHEFYDSLNKYKSLQHYGTKGQKWGVRNWQNPDGTFNEAGKERYFGKARHEGRKLLNEAKDELERDMRRMELLKQDHKDHNNLEEFNRWYPNDGFKDIAEDFLRTDYAKEFVNPIFKDYFNKTKEINSKINNMPESKNEWEMSSILNALVDQKDDDIYNMYLYSDIGHYNDLYITNKAIRILRNDTTLLDEYKESKDKFDNDLNKVLKNVTKDLSEEEKEKFIDNVIDEYNDQHGVFYIDEQPNRRSDNSDIYGTPINPKKLDKIEDMKNNLDKAEEIYSKMKDIQSQINSDDPDNIKHGHDLIKAIASTMNKLELTDKKFEELTEKDWNNIIKEGKKKFAENKKESEIQSHINDKKYDIFLKLENTYGEMIWHYNNWDYINEAKKNLGYDKIEDGKLTDAQWNKIKKEIIDNTGKKKFQEYKEKYFKN